MQYRFPEGRKFAFTIIDDTDVSTVENTRPFYALLEKLGMRTTKTVWPVGCPEGSPNFRQSETLEDSGYREFVLGLHRSGFEIASHGATMESSTRDRTLRAFQRFYEIFGEYPRVHANHSFNRENVYWGPARLDNPFLRQLYGRITGRGPGYYQGEIEGSDYWWGDVLEQRIEYTRNLSFHEINLLRINPTMPYHDPTRPLVHWWFSGTDAEGVVEFRQVLRSENQERLEREGGVCILSTHLGKRYVVDGKVDLGAQRLLEELAGRNGWFPPVGELLDLMRAQNAQQELPRGEWRRMQWRWARNLMTRKVKEQWRYRRRRWRRG